MLITRGSSFATLLLSLLVCFGDDRIKLVVADNLFVVDPTNENDAVDINLAGTNSVLSKSSKKSSKKCGDAGYVNCVNGLVRDDAAGTTCEAACGGKCCVGAAACEGFTGIVCQDDSCSSDAACQSATISFVINSCKGGPSACFGAASSQGVMVNSCTGLSSCENFGNGGKVGNAENSCNGSTACKDFGSNSGNVGDVKDSCNGDKACSSMSADGGSVGSITKSCNHDVACFSLAQINGAVGDLNDSCNDENSCTSLTFDGGSIGSIDASCNGVNACFQLGTVGGVTGNVKKSCNAESSCSDVASNDGSIGSINESCNAFNACESAGSGFNGPITSDLTKCCNMENECLNVPVFPLPDNCTSRNSKVSEGSNYLV
jgi:hypothetical protein